MQTNRDRQLRPPLAPTALAIACALLAVGCWAGCSTEKHFKTLSIFFDGVPDPNATVAGDADPGSPTAPAAGRNAAGGLPRVIVSRHKPFVEEKCADCHTESERIFTSVVNPDLCVKCHEKVLDAYPAMHGPVVGKACLWCHEPHQSGSPSLLRTTTASLCTDCHDADTLTRETPEHVAEDANCLTCHGGHGGDKPPFLRALATTRALLPTTRPQ